MIRTGLNCGWFYAIWTAVVLPLCGQMPRLSLPTQNKAVLEARPQDFYMHVNRHFEGVSSAPWQAGGYGFVRNLKRLSPQEVIGTRFHEGVDIKPLQRDSKGHPLDPVRAVARGRVAYVNAGASRSNYGKYLVLVHDWGEGEFYSLYAHLSEISVAVGTEVAREEELGIMGYTGVGLNRARAHLHFELGMILSEDFERWYQSGQAGSSGHGNYHGRNLVGLDAVALLRAQRQGEIDSVAAFLGRQKRYFAITFPRSKSVRFLERYPWLILNAPQATKSPSLEMSFTASGLPLYVKASSRAVASPTLTYVEAALGFHQDRTQKRLQGKGNEVKLSASGKRYLALILGQY